MYLQTKSIINFVENYITYIFPAIVAHVVSVNVSYLVVIDRTTSLA